MNDVTPIRQPVSPLKPERIGLTFSPANRVPLKPERIGLRLQKLPGWELTGDSESSALWRGFRFQRTETAQAFAGFASELGRDHGQRPVISQSWNVVTVTLPAEGGITASDLDFVERLMLLPEMSQVAESEPQPTPDAAAPATASS